MPPGSNNLFGIRALALQHALTGLHATDPQFGCTLERVMNSHGCKKFDPSPRPGNRAADGSRR